MRDPCPSTPFYVGPRRHAPARAKMSESLDMLKTEEGQFLERGLRVLRLGGPACTDVGGGLRELLIA